MLKEVYSVKKKGQIELRPGFRYDGEDENSNANWSPIICEDTIDTSHNGVDDGISDCELPISVTDEVGEHGEAVYTLKTVYTSITVDGEKDPAYSYGLHFKGGFGSDEEYYKDRGTSIEAYMVRCQDGRIYVYGEVTDPDIVVNDEIMSFKPHYCDGLHPYIDYNNYRQFSSKIGLITASDEEKYIHRAPKGCVIRMTEKGFIFEYSFDNQGKPFLNGDTFGFNFFYNDTNEYVDMTSYRRTLVKLPSRLNPEGTPFEAISAGFDDAIRVSDESATGAFSLSDTKRPEKTGDMLSDLMSGAAKTAVVYDKLASAHTVIAANNIWKRLRNYGVRATIGNDDDCEIAIYVGGRGDVKYNEYSLTFHENGISVLGWLEDGVNTAEGMLLSALDYIRHGGNSKMLAESYGGRIDGTPLVPEMDNLSTVTDAGGNAYLLLSQNAEPDDFDIYAKKLTEEGYKLYAENRMVSVRCATYVSDKAIVNLTYGEKDRSIRAVVDAADKTTLPKFGREEYTPTCDTFISQLATGKMIWMCYAVRLDNGEFLMIDSGGNNAGKHLYESLMRMSGGENVTVAAWILTHFHQDHIGGLVSMVSNDEYMKKIKIKKLIHNFPQKQLLDTAFGAGDRRNINMWEETVRKTGAEICRARTGQRFTFANVDVEMLFTYEDLMPFNVFAVRTNPTSHILSLSVAGQKLMILGDACRQATELCALRYGESLKSDFVQLSHHGWGDISTYEDFYRLVDAPYVLYPSTTYSPKPSEQIALGLAKEYFLNTDEDVIIPLPYRGKEG